MEKKYTSYCHSVNISESWHFYLYGLLISKYLYNFMGHGDFGKVNTMGYPMLGSKSSYPFQKDAKPTLPK